MTSALRKGLDRFCAASPFQGKRFAPRWWSIPLVAACVALFVHLGQWQQGKAERKQEAQERLAQQVHRGPIALPTIPLAPTDLDALNYAPVTVRGRFEPERQFLVDNRVYQERAGYHVITPLHLAGSDLRLLVNRGWIPAAADHRDIPPITTPGEELTLSGIALVPGQRFFTLGAEPPQGAGIPWQVLWQNLDLARFQAAVPYPVHGLVLQLDASAPAGFVRDWPRPDERWEKHLSYALQWYGFAVSALLIWFFMGWQRR
ncbi:SURF1 family protein [Denitratisoma sp. agr-D3]